MTAPARETSLPADVRALLADRLDSKFCSPVAAAAAIAAVAHIPVIAPHLDEAPYMGVLFILLTLACLGLATLVLIRDSAAAYLAAALICGLAVIGYAATRLVAFPMLADDVGNWFEPLGVVSIASESLVVLFSALALSPAHRRNV